ncbi:MAG: hypothetical protein WBD96_15920, partial [Pseudolabrys sp.]
MNDDRTKTDKAWEARQERLPATASSTLRLTQRMTGWYVGVNAGASFGRAKTDFNVDSFTAANIINHVNLPGFAGSDTESPSGFIGGGQIGYNWQYSPLIVVGLEADFQGALE